MAYYCCCEHSNNCHPEAWPGALWELILWAQTEAQDEKEHRGRQMDKLCHEQMLHTCQQRTAGLFVTALFKLEHAPLKDKQSSVWGRTWRSFWQNLGPSVPRKISLHICVHCVCPASLHATWSNSPPGGDHQLNSCLHPNVQSIQSQIKWDDCIVYHWSSAQEVLVPCAHIDIEMFDKLWLAQMTNSKHPSRSDQEGHYSKSCHSRLHCSGWNLNRPTK